jgi:prevent-host-death family protein
MMTMTASEAKNRFGEVLELAQREPIAIERHGRTSVYVVAGKDYELFQEFMLEKLRTRLAIAEGQADRGKFSKAGVKDIIRSGKERRARKQTT